MGRNWYVHSVQRFGTLTVVTARTITSEYKSWTALAWVIEMEPVRMAGDEEA